MKSFMLLAIMLLFLSCDEITSSQSTTTTPADTVYVVVQSSSSISDIDLSSGIELSSSSIVKFTPYKVQLNSVGVPRTYTVDGRVGKLSTKSTSKVTVIDDTTLRVDFTANDVDTALYSVEWLGGHTMVFLEFDITNPLDYEYMDSVTIGRVEIGKNIDPAYFGYVYGNDKGIVDLVARNRYSDSNKDGLIYNLSWNVSVTPLLKQKCVDGLCSSAICSQASCDATRIGFYFWASQGTSYVIVSGMSVSFYR